MANLEVVRTGDDEFYNIIKTSKHTNIKFGNKQQGVSTSVIFENGQAVINNDNTSKIAYLNANIYDAFMKLVGDDNELDESDLTKAKQLFGNRLDDSKLASEGIITVNLNDGNYFSVDIYTKAEQEFDKELSENTKSTVEKSTEAFGKFLYFRVWERFAKQIDRFTERW